MLSWQVWADPILILSAVFVTQGNWLFLKFCSFFSDISCPVRAEKRFWVSGFDTNLFSCLTDYIQRSCSTLNRFIERETWRKAYLYFNRAQILFCLTWIALYEVFINLGTTARYRQKKNILTLEQQDVKRASCLLTTVRCCSKEKLWEEFCNCIKVFLHNKSLRSNVKDTKLRTYWQYFLRREESCWQ